MTEDIKPVVLGPSERNAWRVSGGQADLVGLGPEAAQELVAVRDQLLEVPRPELVRVPLGQ